MLSDVPQNAFTDLISAYLNINILDVRDSLNIFDSIFLVAQMGLFIGIMGTVPVSYTHLTLPTKRIV